MSGTFTFKCVSCKGEKVLTTERAQADLDGFGCTMCDKCHMPCTLESVTVRAKGSKGELRERRRR